MSRKFTVGVLGLGNTGCAMAVELELNGARAIGWSDPQHREIFNKIVEQGYLGAAGKATGRFHPEAQAELGEVLKSADLTFVTVSAQGHKGLLEKLVAHKNVIEAKQAVLIVIGSNFCAPLWAKELHTELIMANRALHASRTKTAEDGIVFVNIGSTKRRMVLAGWEAAQETTRAMLSSILPVPVEWMKDTFVLDLFRHFAHGHLITTVDCYERGDITEPKYFYRERVSISVPNIEKVDDEIHEIVTRLGFPERPRPFQQFNADYGKNLPDLLAVVTQCDDLNSRREPVPGKKDRNFLQDGPEYLALIYEFGINRKVAAPRLRSYLERASKIVEIDLFKCGKTLETYGLSTTSTLTEIYHVFNVRRPVPGPN